MAMTTCHQVVSENEPRSQEMMPCSSSPEAIIKYEVMAARKAPMATPARISVVIGKVFPTLAMA